MSQHFFPDLSVIGHCASVTHFPSSCAGISSPSDKPMWHITEMDNWKNGTWSTMINCWKWNWMWLERFENDDSEVKPGRAQGWHKSMVQSILKKFHEHKSQGRVALTSFKLPWEQKASYGLKIMVHLLLLWINDLKKNIFISLANIQSKMLMKLFASLKGNTNYKEIEGLYCQ